MNDVRLRKHKYSPLVEIESLEPLFELVDASLIDSLTKSGREYAQYFWQFMQTSPKNFQSGTGRDLDSSKSVLFHDQEKTFSQQVIDSEATIELVLSQILVTSLTFGNSSKPEFYEWDYVTSGAKEHVIVCWQKSAFVYSYARFFIAWDLFYFGLELYISNEFQSCAYQRVCLLKYPIIVPLS